MKPSDESLGSSPTLTGKRDHAAVEALAAGTVLGNYRIVRFLGAGGMGAVYVAEHIHLKTRHALKTIRPEFARRPGFEERFLREARLTAHLKHPHIVPCSDAGVANGTPYLVMDYIEGPAGEPLNLRQLLDQRRERGELLDEDEAVAVGLEICKALDYAHSFRDAEIPHGIIHRDLKPGNILLDKDTKLYIADFGLARLVGEKFEENVVQAHALSRSLGEEPTLRGGTSSTSSDAVGTFDYMSPEQREGRTADARSDVYALGAILYELLTGRKVVGAPAPPSRVRLGLNPVWDDIILGRCLAYEPNDRYPTAGELARAIERTCFQPLEKPPQARSPSASLGAGNPWETGKKAKIIGAIAAGIAGVLVVGSMVKWLASSEQKPVPPEQKLAKEVTTNTSASVGTPQSKPFADILDSPTHPPTVMVMPSPAKEKTPERKTPPVHPSLDMPFENSLGMQFVPVTGTKVLFCKWETRVQDFEAFVKATGYDATEDMYSLRNAVFERHGDMWKTPGFDQSPLHPVCGVNWDDAQAFCNWLTEKERNDGRILSNQIYRLPTDLEWSAAVGLPSENGASPKYRNGMIKDVYPWGDTWPPPHGAGNLAGEELRGNDWFPDLGLIAGYNDGYQRTAPVGSFKANQYGLFDMSGNLWEWCEDWLDDGQTNRVLRGGSALVNTPKFLMSSFRYDIGQPQFRIAEIGFRVVLGLSFQAEVDLAQTKPVTTRFIVERTVGEVFTVDLGGGVKMEFAWIPPGEFLMGSLGSETSRSDDETQHRVTLSKGFWMGKTEVTQAQWERVMGSNPSYFKGANLPVETVRWNDCQEFIGKINVKCEIGNWKASLPTEAQWEYACRAGTKTRFNTGDTEADLTRAGWYGSNSDHKTHSVGEKEANTWGLLDMHGNVWEWCQDWFGKYESGMARDPTGPSSGSNRVLRGGSWYCSSGYCRSAYRYRFEPGDRDNDIGLRVVLLPR